MWKIVCCLVNALCALGISGFSFQQTSKTFKKVEYQCEVEKWLNNVDADLSQFNALSGYFTWQMEVNPDEKMAKQASQLVKARNSWKNKVCESNIRYDWITREQRRKLFLLCRGPKITDDLALQNLNMMADLRDAYNSQVCLKGAPTSINRTAPNFPRTGDCLYGEPDLERIMKRTDLTTDQLKWIWLNWHNTVGPRIKDLFQEFADFQNEAARNNGYHDIGEVWREELEIPNLEKFIFGLYLEVEPIYVALHAVVRHKLLVKYGSSEIDPKGPIPIHLLGNMWGQDWAPLMRLFPISSKNIDLDGKLQAKNLTVKDMVVEAEDFYTSMELPKMTPKFWKHSVFEENQNLSLCHGSAANMYLKDDYRLIMCGKVAMEDFYVVHHEMGHIEYYMAYQEQPAVFQDGTNSAFHESIGDAVMHGVMTPQHLHRLSLLTDEQLSDNNTELFLLFQQALSKIPEIPFSLILDKYRWDIFRGDVPRERYNDYYWHLTKKYRGIVPPEPRRSNYFDAGAKFHIPDNTPYVRYFLSSILQMQIFKSLCELSLYGKPAGVFEDEYLPLHKCDIYGSRNAGKKLLAMMQNGASIRWDEALTIISGTSDISSKPFLEYYEPIYRWLKQYIQSNNVYVGW